MTGKTRHAVHLITMGCAKNVVDSERLSAQLAPSVRGFPREALLFAAPRPIAPPATNTLLERTPAKGSRPMRCATVAPNSQLRIIGGLLAPRTNPVASAQRSSASADALETPSGARSSQAVQPMK